MLFKPAKQSIQIRMHPAPIPIPLLGDADVLDPGFSPWHVAEHELARVGL